MTPMELRDKFAAISLEDEIEGAIIQTSYEIDALVANQLQAGIDGSGNKIAPTYASPYYAAKKNRMNAAPGIGVPDLFVTGAYYKGIGVTIGDGTYNTESNVPYADAPSITQYGDKLLSMTEDSKIQYLPILRAAMVSRITDSIK